MNIVIARRRQVIFNVDLPAGLCLTLVTTIPPEGRLRGAIMNVMSKHAAVVSHPLDALTAAEIESAAAVVRGAEFFNSGVKFETVCDARF